MEAQSRPRVLDWAFDALSSLPMLAFPRCLFSIPELDEAALPPSSDILSLAALA